MCCTVDHLRSCEEADNHMVYTQPFLHGDIHTPRLFSPFPIEVLPDHTLLSLRSRFNPTPCPNTQETHVFADFATRHFRDCICLWCVLTAVDESRHYKKKTAVDESRHNKKTAVDESRHHSEKLRWMDQDTINCGGWIETDMKNDAGDKSRHVENRGG